jgi:hypothetical protein
MKPKLSFFLPKNSGFLRVRTRRKILLGGRFIWEEWNLRVSGLGWEGDRMVVHVR